MNMILLTVLAIVLAIGAFMFSVYSMKMAEIKFDMTIFENEEIPTATASAVNKKNNIATVLFPFKELVNETGESVNFGDDYFKVVASGKSMVKFGIKDKSLLYVKKSDSKNLDLTKKNLFLILRVNENDLDKIQYKIRKFVGFYDCSQGDSSDNFEKCLVALNITEEKRSILLKKYENEHEKMKIRECVENKMRLVISETTPKKFQYNRLSKYPKMQQWCKNRLNGLNRKTPYFSFHSENLIEGYVNYMTGDIKVIEMKQKKIKDIDKKHIA